MSTLEECSKCGGPICWYCGKHLGKEHTVTVFHGIRIVGCPEHPKDAGITVVNTRYIQDAQSGNKT